MTAPGNPDTVGPPPECPNCGAAATERVCPYCGTVLVPEWAVVAVKMPPPKGLSFRGPLYSALGVAGMAALYAYGWRYEDTEYWLDARAMTVWTALLPLLALAWTACWAPRWGSTLSGLLAAVVAFGVHLGIMAAVEGRVQDDYVGIAALVGGALAAGWFAGRGLRRFVIRAWTEGTERDAAGPA